MFRGGTTDGYFYIYSSSFFSSVGVEAASVTALPVATQSIQPPSSRPRSFTTIADHYNYIVSFSLSPRPSHGTAFHTRTHANLKDRRVAAASLESHAAPCYIATLPPCSRHRRVCIAFHPAQTYPRIIIYQPRTKCLNTFRRSRNGPHAVRAKTSSLALTARR